jgi:hypothetical protein
MTDSPRPWPDWPIVCEKCVAALMVTPGAEGETMGRVKVTMVWDNGDTIITHEEWDDIFASSLGEWGPEDAEVVGIMESYGQSDFHPLRDMDEWSDGTLTIVRVERVPNG